MSGLILTGDRLHPAVGLFLDGAHATTKANIAWIRALNKLVITLDYAGWWDGIDVLCLAAPVEADALRNIKSPGTYNATNINSCTYSYNGGPGTDWGFDIVAATPAYIETNYAPNSGQWESSSNFAFVYERKAPDIQAIGSLIYLFGCEDDKFPSSLYFNAVYGFWYSTGSEDNMYIKSHTYGTNFKRLYLGRKLTPGFQGYCREGYTTIRYYVDNTYAEVTQAQAVDPGNIPWNTTFHIGGLNNSLSGYAPGYYDGAQFAGWGFGKNMFSSASEFNTFRGHIQTFMADIGADV